MQGSTDAHRGALADALTTRNGDAVGHLSDDEQRIILRDKLVHIASGQIALLNQVVEELVALQALDDQLGHDLLDNLKDLGLVAAERLIVHLGAAAVQLNQSLAQNLNGALLGILSGDNGGAVINVQSQTHNVDILHFISPPILSN